VPEVEVKEKQSAPPHLDRSLEISDQPVSISFDCGYYISEALYAETKPFGIHVTVVGSGAFRSDFLDPKSLHRAAELYADSRRVSVRHLIIENCSSADYKPLFLDYLNRSERLSYGKHTPHRIAKLAQPLSENRRDASTGRELKSNHEF
jgi:hypothetical protein